MNEVKNFQKFINQFQKFQNESNKLIFNKLIFRVGRRWTASTANATTSLATVWTINCVPATVCAPADAASAPTSGRATHVSAETRSRAASPSAAETSAPATDTANAERVTVCPTLKGDTVRIAR